MVGKTTNAGQVLTTTGYIFPKYMHCDMRFLVVKISTLPCILNCGLGIKLPESDKLIARIIT